MREPPPESSPRPHAPHVLVVDDDEGTRQTFAIALRLHGFTVGTASSGLEAIRMAGQARVDLLVVDLKLGDMSGIDVIRGWRGVRPPFIVISGFLSVATAVEAMKLGAADVVEKPVDADALVTSVAASLWTAGAAARVGAGAARPPAIGPPRSAAERWVCYVIKACGAASDLKTLECWAQYVAVSYTTLCANCRIMRIRPLDARDFMRVLRAVRRAATLRCPPEVFLDVSDTRTVRMLSLRAGIDLDAHASPASIAEFLARQQFVAEDNLGLMLARERVTESQTVMLF